MGHIHAENPYIYGCPQVTYPTTRVAASPLDVVLLVGPTELKAEIRWFDAIAVRDRGSFWLNRTFVDFLVANIEDGKVTSHDSRVAIS